MHEYAATVELVELAIRECERNNATHPTKLVVELGDLTTYKSEPIQFYYSILKSEHSLLSDTELEIVEVQGEMRCKQCNTQSEIEDLFLQKCPTCDSVEMDIVAGRDFRLKEIILEDKNGNE